MLEKELMDKCEDKLTEAELLVTGYWLVYTTWLLIQRCQQNAPNRSWLIWTSHLGILVFILWKKTITMSYFSFSRFSNS